MRFFKIYTKKVGIAAFGKLCNTHIQSQAIPISGDFSAYMSADFNRYLR